MMQKIVIALLTLISLLVFSGQSWAESMMEIASRHAPVLIADAILGPVGKIDPSQSVELTLINETLDALLVGESGHVQYQVAAGSNLSITLASFPVNLFLSPSPVNISTAYRVTIDGNAITVQVLHLESDAPGDRSLIIARDGTVSVY